MIFKVLTDFRFEVGSALLGSAKLKNSVMGISNAAEQAQSSLTSLGLSIGSSLGVLPTSFVGLMGIAIRSSEAFYDTQLSISNILSANKEHLSGTIETFNDRLITAKTIMGDISDKAREFALPEKELMDFTKLLAPMLIGKGLEGKNFEVSIDISRSLLKSAPNLGLNTYDIQGQLLRLVEGQASMGDTLFRRLVSETSAFSGFRSSKGTKEFNALDAAKRLGILREGLKQFSSDADVITGRLNTLSGQFNILKSNITGFTSIFKPLGDVIKKPIISLMKELNLVIANEGKQIVSNISKIIGPILENPEELAASVMQIKSLYSDVNKAGNVTGLIAIGIGLKHLFTGVKKFKTGEIGFISTAIANMRLFGKTLIANGFSASSLSIALRTTAINMNIMTASTTGLGFAMKILSFPLRFLWFAATRLIAPLIAIVGVFQVFSRAAAMAKIEDIKRLPEIIARSTDVLLRFKVAIGNIISPFTMLFNAVAKSISPLLSKAFLLETALGPLEKTISIFETLGLYIVNFNANLVGLSVSVVTIQNKMIEVATTIPSLIWAGVTGGLEGLKSKAGSIFTEWEGGLDPAKAFTMGREGVLDEYYANLEKQEGKGAVVNRTTNIAKVEINNKFKEQMEPDRIAFTLADQLQKLASNPRQARGGSRSPVAMPVASGAY